MGTSVTPTHAAMASAASAVVLASARWPSSAAAPEYSARRSAGLRGALEHKSAPGTDAERKLLALARAIDDLEGVIVQTGVHLDVGDGVLHSENIADVRDGIERIKRIIANALAENFFFRFVR